MTDKATDRSLNTEAQVQIDWGVDLSRIDRRAEVKSEKDTRSPEEIASDLKSFLSSPETKEGHPRFNERFVARNIYRTLYYLPVSQLDDVDEAFRKLSSDGSGIFDTVDKRVPHYAGSFKRMKALSAQAAIEEEQKVSGQDLLKGNSGLKPGEFQTVTINDQGIERKYSVLIPEHVDKRGLLIIGLDGVRQDGGKHYLDFEAQLTLHARNTGAIVMIPHHLPGNLPYTPTRMGQISRIIGKLAGPTRLFDQDILSDPQQRDPKLLEATKEEIKANLRNTHRWNIPESKQNLFPPTKDYSDLKFVLNAWEDLKKRVHLADEFGAITFSNGGLVAQELQNHTDKLKAVTLYMSPRMKDKLPERGTNMMLVFADGDVTLNPLGGPGWPRGWVMDKNTKTNLKQNIPVKEFEQFSKTNKCTEKPEFIPISTERPYSTLKFKDCKEGALKIYHVPKPYGHAVPSHDNLNLAQWSRPAPTDLAEKGFHFVLQNLKDSARKNK